MKRKSFIASALPAAMAFKALSANMANEPANLTIPPYLKPGDTIGITSPAGYITVDDIAPAVKKITEWGYKIKVGATIGKRDFTFGGTDMERLQDFQNMLDDDSVQAVMCARGGYGAIRIMDAINFTKFRRKPKWVIGFSDITFLHGIINNKLRIATIHSKMCNSFPTIWENAEPVQKETIESINQCLRGDKMKYNATANTNNKYGTTTGELIGGNLKCIESLSGSPGNFDTKNKILFVEDTGEYLYSIDRMFWNLKRTGKFEGLRGLIVGGFKVKKDDPGEEFGKTVEQIVLEKTSDCHFPVCFDFPVGHQKNNYALKCGVKHRLNVSADATALSEL